MKKITVRPGELISKALELAGEGDEIILEKGIYREKLEITVPDITIIGQSPEDTEIVYSDYAKKLDDQGREYVTFRTYTAAVTAPGVTFKNLTVKNDALYPEEKGQEVALTVYADRFLAENCAFVSTQDTIFCGPLPPDLIERYDGFLKDSLRTAGEQKQIFKNCFISGTVDFIFGCGDALFDNCEIKSLFDVRGHGYAAAPAHALSQEIGFVFSHCRFTKEETVADGSVFLARPWRDYGKCSFIACEYASHINPEGFNKWNDTDRDKTARFGEHFPDANAKPAGRVPWSKILTVEQADALLKYFK